MVVNCEHVWSEISNYVDGEVDPALRAAMAPATGVHDGRYPSSTK